MLAIRRPALTRYIRGPGIHGWFKQLEGRGAQRSKGRQKKKKKFRVAILSRTCQGKAEKWRSRIPRCGALADVKPSTRGEIAGAEKGLLCQ